MQDFISHHNDARSVTLSLPKTAVGVSRKLIGRQCLPIDSESGDGFYYALLS